MPSSQVKTDTIDGVVLRLLGIKPGTELDYETYFNRIKEQLNAARGKRISGVFSAEEDQLLRAELKRAQKAKSSGARFRVKEGRTRVSSVPRQSRTPKPSKPTQKLLRSKGELVKAQSQKIARKEDTAVKKVNVKDVTPKNPIDALRVPLDSIFGILQSRFKFDQKQKEKQRKKEETEKRGKRESSLEGFKKGISEIVSATKKMLAPFEEVINRISRFIFFTLLGRAFTGFMEWMKDKGNQEKFNSFVEFLSKHWPALAGLYILFGTSLGKLTRGIVKLAARMVVALAMMIPKLFSFIRKNKKLSAVGFALGSYASGRVSEMLNSKEAPEAASLAKPTDDLANVKPDIDKIKETPAPKLNAFNLGGLVPKFAAGGINPFGGMDFSEGVPIKGAGKDDTLIAAKTGEAILTEKDQDNISKQYVDKETGQPLNIPQYLSGRKPGQVAFSNLRFPTLGGGFFGGGTIPRFNQGGLVGSRLLGKTPGRAWSPLESVIGNAQQRLLNRQAERNTTYFNPFADIFAKPRWNERLPGVNPEMRRYNMPGYNQNKWLELEHFRGTTPSGPRGGWEKKDGRLRYTPRYQRPGFNRPLSLQKGGKVEAQRGSNTSKFNLINPRARTIFDRLVAGGLSRIAAAGIVSNIGVETGYTYDPSTHQRRGGPGRGLVQWERGGRFDTDNINLLSFAKGRNKSWNDLNTQVDFILHELNTHPEYQLVKQEINASRDVPSAVKIFLSKYEKAGVPHVEDRLKVAQQLIQSGYLAPPQPKPKPKPQPKNPSLTDRIGAFASGVGENIRNLFGSFGTKRKQQGGIVKEGPIKKPGATADRIPALLEPGEFVVTKRATKTPGVLPALENLNRTYDSNSAAYLGKTSVKLPQITPPMSRASVPNIMELPPIMTSASGSLRPRASGLGGGSQVPSFSAVAPDNERDKNASIYGLVG